MAMLKIFILLLVPLFMLSGCYSSREDFHNAGVSIASHDFSCPPEQITLNSVREEHDPFTDRLRAITYEAAGCGHTKLYRANDERITNVVTVLEIK